MSAARVAADRLGATIWFVMGPFVLAFFKIQNALIKGGIRSTEADEIAGLDRPEMGVLAYDNLQIREIDIVGIDPSQDKVLATGGESPDPSHRAVTRSTTLRDSTAGGPRRACPPAGRALGCRDSCHVPETMPRPRRNSLLTPACPEPDGR